MFCKPSKQYGQWPHAMLKGTHTRVPTVRSLTLEPTLSTTPPIS